MNQSTKALLRSLTTVLVCLAIIFAFLISGIRLFGFQVYGVLTGSMTPAYPVGSLIYVRETSPEDLKLRDVITFSSGKTIVTHRIVEVIQEGNSLSFRTKGDANDNPDASLVGPAQIIGRVSFGIPHLGNIANYIQNPPGIYVTIVLGLVLIGLVIMMDNDDSKKKEGQPAEENRIKLPEMPWLTALLAKVGVTWPKKQEEPPQSYMPPQMQQYPQQMQQYPQQMQQYPQQMQQYPQQVQQYPQQMQQYPQYPQQPQQYPPQMQQYPQGYGQQYPQQMQQPQQYPQGYGQQYPQYPQYPQGYPQQQQQQMNPPLQPPRNPLA